jgi:hypothetical protein
MTAVMEALVVFLLAALLTGLVLIADCLLTWQFWAGVAFMWVAA